jgi:hypothetical protein
LRGRPRLLAPSAGSRPFFVELLWLGLGRSAVVAAWAARTIIRVGWHLSWSASPRLLFEFIEQRYEEAAIVGECAICSPK